MENISKHITFKEATTTNSGILNLPNEKQLKAMKLLAEKVFEPLREHFGTPIKINSMFRSAMVNKAIGGSSTSQHCANNGAALDLDGIGSLTNKMIFDYIKDNLDFDQLIHENGTDENPAWVHVSYKEKNNRKEVLRFKNKKYTKY